MLELELYAFTYPGEDGSCINQTNKGFNVSLTANLQQIRLIYMQQCTIRMNDYFMFQVLGLLGNQEPVASNDRLDSADDIVQPFVNKIKGTDPFWQLFDLKQTQFCPGLDVKIKSPLIVIPDLSSSFGGFNKRFELDLGTVKITTEPVDVMGRWKHWPSKSLKMMQVKIENTDLKFDFRDKSSKQYKPIFYEKRIDLDVQIPNSSPYFLKEDAADYQGPHFVDREGNMFDPSFVDTSLSVRVTQKFFQVMFLQVVLQQMFELLENNFIKKDAFTDHFEVVLKNKRLVSVRKTEQVAVDADIKNKFLTASSVVRNQMVPENDNIQTIAVLFHFYCLSIELRDDENKLVSEFCLLNTDLGYDAFESGRSSAFMRAHSFFILHDEDPKMQTKKVLMGSNDDKNVITTNETFYTKRPLELR